MACLHGVWIRQLVAYTDALIKGQRNFRDLGKSLDNLWKRTEILEYAPSQANLIKKFGPRQLTKLDAWSSFVITNCSARKEDPIELVDSKG